MHPKTKISFRLITILLNLFIIFSLLFNFGGNTPVKAQTETDPPIGLAHPLEILQGSLLRRQVLSGEMASITLNISDPQPDVSYSWMILEAPSHGNSQVIATGAEATITYLAEPGFEGEDFLKVVAQSSTGESASTTIMMTVSPMVEEVVIRSPQPSGSREALTLQPESHPFLVAADDEAILNGERIFPEVNNPEREQRSTPVLYVNLKSGQVDGHNWLPLTNITLTIGEDDWTSLSSEDGSVSFDIDDLDLLPDQLIEMTDGTTSISHTVIDLGVTYVDTENDIVYGKGAPDSSVDIYAYDGVSVDNYLNVTTNESGNWEANFSGQVEIGSDTSGYIYQYDTAGNSTWTYWEVPDPKINAYLESYEVQGSGWPENTTITLTINSQTWTEQSDEYNGVYFWTDPLMIEPGMVIEMTGGGYTRTHTVVPLEVSNIDEINDTISGTAPPNGAVDVSATDGLNWESLTVPTDPSTGAWLADFDALVDIGPGSDGSVSYYDTEENRTILSWYVPDPYFGIGLTYNEVIGERWPGDTLVTLEINGQQWSELSESDGWVSFYVSPYDIQPGDFIEMYAGTLYRSYTVANLTITAIDEVNDTISGTADPEMDVQVYGSDGVSNDWKDTTADISGDWSVDFSDSVDIKPGTRGSVWQYDENYRFYTAMNWSVPNPYIVLFHNQNYDEINIHGEDWPAFTDVTMTLNGVQTVKTTDEYGWAWFGAYDPSEIVGQTIAMTDGTYERSYALQALDFTDINVDADTVSGTSDPGTLIEVLISEASGMWPSVETTTNSSGAWLADFTGKADIRLGDEIFAEREDENGNRTQIYWQIPNPYIAAMIGQTGLYGNDWAPDTLINLTINDTLEFTAQSDSRGYAWFNLYNPLSPPLYISAGDKLVMTDGIDTRTHYVADLSITDYDLVANTISGTADPNQDVNIYARGVNNSGSLVVTANSSGLWFADFDGYVDIGPDSYLHAQQYDAEGNFTNTVMWVPNPKIIADLTYNRIYGEEWQPNSEISLSIDSTPVAPRFSDNYGSVNFTDLPVDLQAGQELVMSDGVVTRTHIVRDIALTEIDQAADILRGTADPESWVWVLAYNDFFGYEDHILSDQDGNWEADFSSWVDIAPGAQGTVTQEDGQSNQTRVSWYVPLPYVSVYPISDFIYGRRFAPNTPVTLTIGSYQWSVISGNDGSVRFEVAPFDIKAGQKIQMTDGENSLTYTVNNIMITEINPETDILKGKAKAGSEIWGLICSENTCHSDDFTTDSTGVWIADFSTVFDMTADSRGYAIQSETNDNNTILEWHVPHPSMSVYPLGDEVFGFDFTPNAVVTLTVDSASGQQWTATADVHGAVYFDISSFDLLPGQTVTLSDGLFSATHTIFDIQVTSTDETTEIIAGTGAPGRDIDIQACNEDACEWVNTTTDTTGDWEADFTGLVDVQAGTTGFTQQQDDEGDYTIINWFLINPQLVVNPDANEVYGYQWPPNEDITLEISEGGISAEARGIRSIWTGRSNEKGTVIFSTGEFDIVPGQTVTLKVTEDEMITVQHQTRFVTVTELDSSADRVMGTTDPLENVTVKACNLLGCDQVTTAAGGTGLWQADFSTLVNIVPGAYGTACVTDELGEKTCVNWQIEEGYNAFLPLLMR